MKNGIMGLVFTVCILWSTGGWAKGRSMKAVAMRCYGTEVSNCTPHVGGGKSCSEYTGDSWSGSLEIFENFDESVQAVKICKINDQVSPSSVFYDASGQRVPDKCGGDQQCQQQQQNPNIPQQECVWSYPEYRMDIQAARLNAENFVLWNYRCESEKNIQFLNWPDGYLQRQQQQTQQQRQP
ncbi:hypothetical protein WDW37_19155 [Bdellovibrionota bacterium FG-1]